MRIKSISALLILALCVTIGGGYAVWTYAGTDDIADAFAEAKVTIADTELTGANGTYKIESNLVLTVDQKNSDHEAELKFSANDGQPIYLRITFTPADNAPQKIKDEAVPSEFYFTVSTPMQFPIISDDENDDYGHYNADKDPVDIFLFTNCSNGIFEPNIVWHKEDNGTFTYTIYENDLKSMINLSQTFYLDEKSEHDRFREALGGNIVARVTDGTVN